MASISDVLTRLTSSPYLLEKQFCRVRNGKLSHILGAFAICTPPPISEEAAGLTCIHFEFIRRDHQTLEQKLGCAIANETVAFHLAETQTAFTGSAFCGLSCQRCARSPIHDHSATGRSIMPGKPDYSLKPRTLLERASCPSPYALEYD
jgi:hypothetical protein